MTVQPLHQVRFPGESGEYRVARDRLLAAEVELRDLTEAVAQQRRGLPLGGEVPVDYEFDEWDEVANRPRPVRLSELFEPGRDTLFLYSFMFIPDAAGNPLGQGCPSCTSIIGAVAGEVVDLTQRISFAVAAKVPIGRFRAHARDRGWPEIRLLSSAGSDYPRDYHTESASKQDPIGTVFVKRDGRIHHFWSTELYFLHPPAGQDRRHVDFMWPLWNILDCTPGGRGSEWRPELSYR